MRLLGVDAGRRRIGLAVSDVTGLIATPLKTVVVRNQREAADAVLREADLQAVDGIVIGLPITERGEEGEEARRVRDFAAHLSRLSRLPIYLWDERYSTLEADKILRAMGIPSPKRRPRLDAVAAAVILQSYLNARRIPTSMRAVVFERHGSLDVLQVREAPVPDIGDDEALVRVRACGLNHLDIMVREGVPWAQVVLPHVPGSECSGEIVKLGRKVEGLQEGMAVTVFPYLFCGHCSYCLRGEENVCEKLGILGVHSQGCYAEYVKVPIRNLMPLPPELSFVDAAAVTLATLTAWHMLVGRAHVHPGEWVLVMAAGSGVGSAAVQIAKMAGAYVIAAAGSQDKLDKAVQLGADYTVNYSTQDLVKEVMAITHDRGVDVVVEHVGTSLWERCVQCLARLGRIVTVGGTTGTAIQDNLSRYYVKQLSLLGSYGGNRFDLRTVLSLTAQGRIRPVIHRILPLEQAAEGQRLLEDRLVFGKVILTP
jgi:putative transcription antitermination factor YqgF